jgi:hypothetical protein
MLDKLSNKEISDALDELMTCLGVKEEVSLKDLLALLREKNVQGCVQAIAAHLGLPISISLSYVPKDFEPGSDDGFRSSALARTDWTGHGIESITAQVAIPEHLPMFGTSDLQGYPIRVRVSENCWERPETLVAVMAHELSHVLLRSLYHSQHDSELHTDLVPILLGFRDVVQRGRKIVQCTTSGDVTTTHTTTYGYLTDSQFEFACDKVKDVLRQHQRDKKYLLGLVERMLHKLKKAAKSLETFRDYLRYLDTHIPERMRETDAQRVVKFHVWDYSKKWEDLIAEAKNKLERADAFVRPLSHYTGSGAEQLKEHTKGLELAFEKLGHVTKAITEDVKTLRRYVSFFYIIQKLIRH